MLENAGNESAENEPKAESSDESSVGSNDGSSDGTNASELIPEAEGCLVCGNKKALKAGVSCGICEQVVCKGCARELAEDAFELAAARPPLATHIWYCPDCFETEIQPLLEEYDHRAEQAKAISVIPRAFRGHLKIRKRSLVRVKVAAAKDRDEVMMKLAFQAVVQGFNAIIEFEAEAAQVRNHGYQSSRWSGSALPANVDEKPEPESGRWR